MNHFMIAILFASQIYLSLIKHLEKVLLSQIQKLHKNLQKFPELDIRNTPEKNVVAQEGRFKVVKVVQEGAPKKRASGKKKGDKESPTSRIFLGIGCISRNGWYFNEVLCLCVVLFKIIERENAKWERIIGENGSENEITVCDSYDFPWGASSSE